MARQNRVLPGGEIVNDPARGLLTGNRGILHAADGQLGVARWRHPHWVACALEHPRGVARRVMSPGTWTELFFLDEAVALAAGHRPCAYCRRAAFLRFRAAWRRAGLPGATAPEIDRALHPARVTRRRAQVTHDAALEGLPDGTFIAGDDLAGGTGPLLVLGGRLLRFAPGGYGPALPRPARARVVVLTPRPSVAVLGAGYAPLLHPSAGVPGGA